MKKAEGTSSLMQSYFFYSALLALKLLALAPMASLACNPEKLQRASISNLKNLSPFWLVAGLYMTTSPDEATARALLRTFVIARFVTALGYVVKVPKMAIEASFFVSFAITSFMAGWVVYTYRAAL